MGLVHELENRNAVLTAQVAMLRSLVHDLADDADPLITAYTRLGLVRHFADDLSACALRLALESRHPVDRLVADRMDRTGESLREILHAPLCSCGEEGESE
jgi:hypothetical protein